MIRTGVVNLTVIPAIAYRQKLQAGDVSVVVVCKGVAQPGIAAVSKTSGEPIPAANNPKGFPKEAFEEALELTAGMPYRKLSGVKYVEDKTVEVKEEAPAELVEDVVVESSEYKAVVDAFTDKNDKLSYDLLNKALIKFAHSSSIARKMVAEKASVDEICMYAVSCKFRTITGNADMTDDQVKKIIEMLDEVSPKSVLKEFKSEIKKSLAK